MQDKEILEIFETDFNAFLSENFDDYLINYLSAKSKRLRPILGMLFVKAIGQELTKQHMSLFLAVELTHNASLIHDDVIDNAVTRRKRQSLNAEFDNSLAVSSGDLILASVMKLILNIENKSVQNLFTSNIYEICQGEIQQYFSKYKMPKLDEYLEKSEKKTALLFEIAILGGVMLCNCEQFYEKAKQFSRAFGLAFQLSNDLNNFVNTKEDYHQGIYTAPIILGKDNGIEKTKDLINNYLNEAFEIIDDLEESEYSRTIKRIIMNLR